MCKETINKRFDEVEADPFYSEENMARLRDAIKEYEAGHYTEHELIEV